MQLYVSAKQTEAAQKELDMNLEFVSTQQAELQNALDALEKVREREEEERRDTTREENDVNNLCVFFQEIDPVYVQSSNSGDFAQSDIERERGFLLAEDINTQVQEQRVTE